MKKHIDIKSLLIGIFLASTVLLAIGATSPTDRWDKTQRWEVRPMSSTDRVIGNDIGWEPFGVQGANGIYRKRVK
jgi:hypothetical protein